MGAMQCRYRGWQELANVVAREVRMKHLNGADARNVLAEFDRQVSDSLVLLMATFADFGFAREYVERLATGLRAGDAPHLAIAGYRSAKKLFTLDNSFLAAGKRLKLPVTRGIKA